MSTPSSDCVPCMVICDACGEYASGVLVRCQPSEDVVVEERRYCHMCIYSWDCVASNAIEDSKGVKR